MIFRRAKKPPEDKRDWVLSIHCYDMTNTEADDFFDRVARAAHIWDDEVFCSIGPALDLDDRQDWA